jgi:hypothetical protein
LVEEKEAKEREPIKQISQIEKRISVKQGAGLKEKCNGKLNNKRSRM